MSSYDLLVKLLCVSTVVSIGTNIGYFTVFYGLTKNLSKEIGSKIELINKDEKNKTS